jgi:ketosteroid isomerase-like protein
MARYTGVGRGSGLPLDVEGAHVWTFRDGEAVRLEIFADRARALESAGLLGTAGR